MKKITYEIDPHNRLIYSKTGKESKIPRYRKILDGEFSIDDKNTLTYRIKQPQSPDIPQEIKLSKEIISAKDDELAFSVITEDYNGNIHINIIKLTGAWQADKYNRLTFQVMKESGPPDKLVLKGAWEVNKQNQIIYTHTKTRLKTKEKEQNTITFKGYWDITQKDRISYILNKEINSVFDFKVSVERPEQNYLKYQIGIGVTPKKKELAVFGRWRIDKTKGLLFEIEYYKGDIKAISFGAVCNFAKDKTLKFKLKNDKQENLGIDLKLSKTILKDQGEAFIQTLASRRKIEFLSGVGFRW